MQKNQKNQLIANRQPATNLRDYLKNAASVCAQRDLPLKAVREEFERLYIQAILKKTRQNRSKASEILQIHRNTLALKLDKK